MYLDFIFVNVYVFVVLILWTSYSTMAVEDDEQHIGNTEVPKDMEEVKSDSNTETWKRLYTTKEL